MTASHGCPWTSGQPGVLGQRDRREAQETATERRVSKHWQHNAGPSARTGTAVIAGMTFTVEQGRGKACTY